MAPRGFPSLRPPCKRGCSSNPKTAPKHPAPTLDAKRLSADGISLKQRVDIGRRLRPSGMMHPTAPVPFEPKAPCRQAAYKKTTLGGRVRSARTPTPKAVTALPEPIKRAFGPASMRSRLRLGTPSDCRPPSKRWASGMHASNSERGEKPLYDSIASAVGGFIRKLPKIMRDGTVLACS